MEEAKQYEKDKGIFSIALDTLSGQWVPAIVTSIIIGLVSAAASFVPLGSLLIYGPLYLGAAIWALKFVQGKEYDYEDVFKGFNNFGKALGVGVLTGLIVLGFTLLLIVPGIIAALALSQVFFIQAENPDMEPSEILRKSRDMMQGHKTELFVIYLVIVLLAIACLITLGIGFIFLIPFIRIVMTHFYLKIRGPIEEQDIMDQLIEE
jgi:uncharacterized membrane protein